MTAAAASAVTRKLERGDRLRVVFVNDVGFQFGAGIAHLRQIQSFVLLGHEVAGICWSQGVTEDTIPLTPEGARGVWLGMSSLGALHRDRGLAPTVIADALLGEIEARNPDVVIVGNLHLAHWPLEIYHALRRSRALSVGYMHDCYLVTGRCAYPESCTLYETGCDATCPTAEEYPVLPRDQIAGAWRLRRELFCGPGGIALAANSDWTLAMARRGLAGARFADVVYYGLDDRLFSPIDRALARRLLGIPPDLFVVLGGAVNIAERRKGGALFQQVASALGDEAHVVVFGVEAGGRDKVQTTGLLRDYRKMPLLYSAADVFVGTSLEEAFGQTFCEAAACGIPIVAFAVGGVPEIARHDRNARLVAPGDVGAMIEEIRGFSRDRERGARFGRAGRELVEQEFTLRAQGERWMRYLAAAAGAA